MNRFVLPVLALLLATPALAELRTETIEYRDGEVTLRGHLAWDDSLQGPRPGIIVVHEWWGLNDYARSRAEQLAGMGYVAFAVDMYGDDKVTSHGSQAKEWMQQITANADAWRARALLGLEVLRGRDEVDADKLAAIGYCFGGATVMQMAYAGEDLDGVVSFHGSLPPATPEQAAKVKTRVLIAHGDADSFVPPTRIEAFKKPLSDAGVDWEMNIYSGAKHSFTNPYAEGYGMEGLAYHEQADRRSWLRTLAFFEEIFED